MTEFPTLIRPSSTRTPSLRRFCDEVLPLLHGASSGQRMMKFVRALQHNDRWTSFDRYRMNTPLLTDAYAEAGAETEVYPVPTGERVGSGRWMVLEAQDMHAVTLDVVRPVRRRIANMKHDPQHGIGWSQATPAGGMTAPVVVIDTPRRMTALKPNELTGRIVLTRQDPRTSSPHLIRAGALAVVCDLPVSNSPDAVAWQRLGWGAMPLGDLALRFPGIMLSANQGKALRAMIDQHGGLTLKLVNDVHGYRGTHDLVSGIIRGESEPESELWVLAHSQEPGAMDNASGVATCLEMAGGINQLIEAGRMPRPRRTIRFLNGYECFSFFHYLEHGNRAAKLAAAVVVDTLGVAPEHCDGRLEWRDTLPAGASFVNGVGEAILRSTLRLDDAGYRLKRGPFAPTSDTLLGDPQFGCPCPWLTTCFRNRGKMYHAYHSSADTPDLLSPRGLAVGATAMAGYLTFLADLDTPAAEELIEAETRQYERFLKTGRRKLNHKHAAYLAGRHHDSIVGIARMMSNREASALSDPIAQANRRVKRAASTSRRAGRRAASRGSARRVPRRIAPLSPRTDNVAPDLARRINEPGLPEWALFWADGRRNLDQITTALECELQKSVKVDRVVRYFDALAELEYVTYARA